MKTYKVIVDKLGTISWYNDKGQLHRGDGPACETNRGTKWWYINGKLHREDGPAIEYFNGEKCWYLNNIELPKLQWEAALAELKGPSQEEINKALEVLGKATGYKITKG